jgi:non-specific serine/threonine protein kinase
MAWAISNGGVAARARGDLREADKLFRESLTIHGDLGELWGVAECLEGVAGVAVDAGQFERAAQLFGSAAAVRTAVGYRIAPPRVAKQAQELEKLRMALGPHRFEAAWRTGRELPVNEAVYVALTDDSS